MIKYLGSKRTLVPQIVSTVQSLPDVHRVCDLFTGTTRVAQGLKRAGFNVVANDIATYSEVLAKAFIETDADHVDLDRVAALIEEANALPGVDGYVTRTFAEDARYFHPNNARRIDAIRRWIDTSLHDTTERAILLSALMLAADRVDSTTGLQMAYLKSWAPRALKPMKLVVPELLSGGGRALRMDAYDVVAGNMVDGCDLVYVDPPYNQHSYFGNYHVWETLVRNDEPDAYGVARKRVDTRENRSPFNSSRQFGEAFARVIRGIRSPYVLVSFNNEGFTTAAAIEDLLGESRAVVRWDVDFKRYVGAQIGIHNPRGERVGQVSHLRNTEHLFLAGPKEVLDQLAVESIGG